LRNISRYLGTITSDPEITNQLPNLSEFYQQLDCNIDKFFYYGKSGSSNPLLFDIEGLINLDLSFFKLQATKFDSQTTELAQTRGNQLEKAQDKLIIIKLQYLKAKN
jgi:hypothetical protein